MKTHKLWTWAVLLASFALLFQFSTLAIAQDDSRDNYDNRDYNNNDQGDQQQDPPTRVGRLDYSQGSISFRPAGEDDWVTGVPNRPMVTGDDLWSDENSRAEVHIGSTAIRLGARTGITFLTLDDHTAQIRLAQGTLILRVRHLDDDDAYEVDTPNIAFTLLQPGEYRIDVSQDGSQSVATVWHGRGRVTGGGFSYTVVANQSATFTGDQDHLDYDLAQIPRSDDFDNWAFDRDGREDRSDSANYVSREMTGYEDLDENGDWSYVAGYGPCWRPRGVEVGWAPYRYGHWVYVGPWGWTWVEDEPWGFAPFHYGRWAFVSNSWFWVPGPVVVRPVWAPAMVAFVGGGAGFRAGGGVGWFPLAPGEVYVPGYHVSRAYVNNVNITNTSVNVTKVTNVYNTVIVNKTVNNVTYVNQRVNNSVTVVSHDTFVNARPVARNIVKVDQREIESAPVSHMVAAEPVRSSVVGAGRPVSVKPPAAVISRPVVAVRTPPPPPRPIEQRQAEAGGRLHEQQSIVRPVGRAQPAQLEQGPHQAPPPPQQQGRPAQQQAEHQPAQQQAEHQPAQQQNRPEPPQQQAEHQPAQQQNRPEPPQQQAGHEQPQQQGGFRPFTPPGGNNNEARPGQSSEPRKWEQQGSAEPPARNTPPPQETYRNLPPENRAQPNDSRPAPPSHPLVKPAPPVQERSPQQEQQQQQKFQQWQQQRSSPPPQHPAPAPKESHPAPHPEKPKGH